jgi:hypothetical protein
VKFLILTWLLAAAFAAQPARADDSTATPAQQPPCPLSHGKWEPLPALTDEFNGTTFDTAKWNDHNPNWDGPQPDYFSPANVRVKDGMLILDSKLEDLPNLPPQYHTYTTAAVQTKAKVRYGYFEVRAKAMDSQMCSAFWFYDTTPEQWTEIDVFEVNGRQFPWLYHMNLHVFYTLVEKDRWDLPERPVSSFNFSKDFHVYGLEWNPDEVIWYVDGKEWRRSKNTHWHQPLALQFDSEIKPSWFGMPDKDSLPAMFQVDYVRSWKRLDGPADARPLAIEFRFPGRKEGTKESLYRLKTDGAGTYVVHATDGGERPGHVFTEYDDPAFFAGQTEPEIHKTLTLHDTTGRNLVLQIDWKKNVGLDALLAAKPPADAPNGYAPCGITVPVDANAQKTPGAVDDYLLTAEDGSPVKVTVTWP